MQLMTRTALAFSAALRRAREAAGLSQRALARASGRTAAYISLLEAGRRAPERPAVERLTAALRLADAERDALLLAAGYAVAGRGTPVAGPLAGVEALITAGEFAPEQRTLMLSLVEQYARGLVQRTRAGRPLVSDLAAPWQQRVLEALDEKMTEDFNTYRDAYMRPSFDL
jgi:transcriptional regulator with XRE-family HTH domain